MKHFIITTPDGKEHKVFGTAYWSIGSKRYFDPYPEGAHRVDWAERYNKMVKEIYKIENAVPKTKADLRLLDKQTLLEIKKDYVRNYGIEYIKCIEVSKDEK